jgi:AcrR family transcriptional regulator
MSSIDNGEVRDSRRYRGQDRSQRRAARRRRLLDVGLQTFGTSEYASSSIERLCADAGVTIRSFYEEFDSREALLAAVYDETALMVQESAFKAMTDIGTSLAERVETALRVFIHATLADRRRGRVLCLTSMAVSEAMEQRRRAMIHTFAMAIGHEVGTLVEVGTPAYLQQSYLMVCGLIGASNALVVEYLTASRPPGPDALLQAMKELWVAVIAAAAPQAVASLPGVVKRPRAARPVSA